MHRRYKFEKLRSEQQGLTLLLRSAGERPGATSREFCVCTELNRLCESAGRIGVGIDADSAGMLTQSQLLGDRTAMNTPRGLDLSALGGRITLCAPSCCRM